MVNRPNSVKRYAILGRVLLFLMGSAVLLALVAPLTLRRPGAWSNFALGTITSLGTIALSMLFVRWDGLRLQDIGVVFRVESLLRLVLGLLIGLILVAFKSGVAGYVGHVRWVQESGTPLGHAAIVFCSYLALSLREELAFRGYPLRRLESSFGLWGAQLIVAVAFALEHVAGGLSWMHAFLGAGVGSLLFGMAALATRDLTMPIGLHAAWNFGAWMFGEKETAGLWRAVVNDRLQARYQLVGTLSYIFVMALATMVFWFWYRRVKMKSSPHISNQPA